MAEHTSLTTISKNGLWTNNLASVQLLGLCPLLAVSNNAVNALGLGIATICVLMLSNLLIALLRQWILPEIRIAVFVLIIASTVTLVERLIQAYAYPLYQSLGIYLPLIVTNCGIMARAESFASRYPYRLALLDGLFMGLGFALVLLVLGCMREILAQGTLFAHADTLFGSYAKNWAIHLFNEACGIVLIALPAGAFICLGLLIALKNAWKKT